jgi:hypothetical protein
MIRIGTKNDAATGALQNYDTQTKLLFGRWAWNEERKVKISIFCVNIRELKY